MKAVKRLFAGLKPSRYTLEITPDIATMTFTGSVTIGLKKTSRPSQRLALHQHDLKIDSAEIIKHDKKGDRSIPVVRINNQNSLDEVRLHTDELLYSGDYTVHLTFHGTITRVMSGLYPSYFTLDGQEHTLLATQLESHYARDLFPCVDEPEAKATFDVTVVAPQNRTVLGNMPVKAQKPHPRSGLVATTFETTPRMSTYLVAFVIGEIQSQSTTTRRGTEVSVWSTIAHPLSSLDFALDVARRSVEFFETYFDMPYPLPKLDHIGVPDFSAGAMENWGLITYRERVLIAYPGETSQTLKEYIAMVICHETSHQWFGNLVTMKWWDDIWLNESFANMMEYQAVDALFPEWHIWDEFIMREGLAALRRDATPGVQAIKTGVRHPDEIETLFDPAIVYAKGGRVLYMLKKYIGEPAFRKGLTSYFKQHAYGNTTGADLWQHLSQASGIDVAAFMAPWLDQSGFPLLRVTHDGTAVTISQSHFLENGEQSDGREWFVPLFASDTGAPKVLPRTSVTYTRAAEKASVINEHSAGHYIVHYESPEHRAAIMGLVAKQELDVGDRLLLLNSASMLSKAGYAPFGEVLELLESYSTERTDAVWSIISVVISEARRFIDLDANLESAIKAFIRDFIQPEYQRLGWIERPDEPASDQKLRATIIGLGVYAEEPAIIAEALRRFEAYQHDTSAAPAELRAIIFGAAVKQQVPTALETLLNTHDHTNNGDLRGDIAVAVTSARDPVQAEQLLVRLTNPKLVKPQDADFWLAYMLGNRYIRSSAWDWMVAHWNWIEETYSHDKSYDYFPRYAASGCNTAEWAERYRSFFEPKKQQLALERAITLGMAEIATRVAWLERDLASVQAFFKAYKPAKRSTR